MNRVYYKKHSVGNVINVSELVTIHYYELEADYFYEGEHHDFWELVYVDSGEIYAKSGEREKLLRGGDLIFHKPFEDHGIRCSGDWGANIFIISFVSKSAAMAFFKERVMKLPIHLKGLISSIIDEGRACYNIDFDGLEPLEGMPIGGSQLIRIYLEMLLILLMRSDGFYSTQDKSGAFFSYARTRQSNLVMKTIEYLNEHVYGELNIKELCEQMHYGKSQLSAIFKSTTEKTIVEYYTELKIEQAKKLIRKGDDSLSQISAALMFTTPQYFSRTFRKITGMTPRQYRNSLKVR